MKKSLRKIEKNKKANNKKKEKLEKLNLFTKN